jgi:hypothetical protein
MLGFRELLLYKALLTLRLMIRSTRLIRIQYGDEDMIVDLHHGLAHEANDVGILSHSLTTVDLTARSCISGSGRIDLILGDGGLPI